MLKSVNFIIEPAGAKPRKVSSEWSGDIYDFDISQVEMSALRETLQTTLAANPFSAFIHGFLVPYSNDLVWIGSGPGVGREMRRAFSAIFGRFFARAYLTDCHGLVWFVPLDGRRQRISERLRVQPSRPRQDLPDWICAGRGGLALAEAKGSKSTGRIRALRRPQQLQQAVKQLEGCRVAVMDRATLKWTERRVKGWAVLNRWSFQSSDSGWPGPPYLYVVDPYTEGKPLGSEEVAPLIREIAREHTASLLRGLRLYELAASIGFEGSTGVEGLSDRARSSAAPLRVALPALGGATAMGRILRPETGWISPDWIVDEIFVGVLHDVIEELGREVDDAPVPLESSFFADAGIFRGADGLVLARRQSVELME